MIDFDYKILKLRDYLSESEFREHSDLVDKFNVDIDIIESSFSSLCLYEKLKNKVKEVDEFRYQKFMDTGKINYNDFIFLNKLFKDNNYTKNHYFNFFLTDLLNKFDKKNDLKKSLGLSYSRILEDIFGKKLSHPIVDEFFGTVNIYPKNSFIDKHSDRSPNNDRLFTTLFFLNKNRKMEDGSILKIYKNNEIIDVIPDFNNVVILEHINHNYAHEVTENLIDNVRYSLYNPFEIKNYEYFFK